MVKKKKTFAGRIVSALGNSVVNIVLAVVAVFWLVPTFGLLLTSLRSSGDNASSGWWNVLTAPTQLTLENYRNLLENETIIGSFW
ncbi:MAG: carbohydrate ABC transporter permease, partial [Propionibacterium sp.]|nr:carbohydrate ABC transporter permease [Propionibacterium sp.]